MNTLETQKIRSIIDNYRLIYNDLNYYEKNLENMVIGKEEKTESKISFMGIKIKECILKLEQERKTEKEFFLLIQEKYGPGEFDIETFQYKIKD